MKLLLSSCNSQSLGAHVKIKLQEMIVSAEGSPKTPQPLSSKRDGSARIQSQLRAAPQQVPQNGPGLEGTQASLHGCTGKAGAAHRAPKRKSDSHSPHIESDLGFLPSVGKRTKAMAADFARRAPAGRPISAPTRRRSPKTGTRPLKMSRLRPKSAQPQVYEAADEWTLQAHVPRRPRNPGSNLVLLDDASASDSRGAAEVLAMLHDIHGADTVHQLPEQGDCTQADLHPSQSAGVKVQAADAECMQLTACSVNAAPASGSSSTQTRDAPTMPEAPGDATMALEEVATGAHLEGFRQPTLPMLTSLNGGPVEAHSAPPDREEEQHLKGADSRAAHRIAAQTGIQLRHERLMPVEAEHRALEEPLQATFQAVERRAAGREYGEQAATAQLPAGALTLPGSNSITSSAASAGDVEPMAGRCLRQQLSAGTSDVHTGRAAEQPSSDKENARAQANIPQRHLQGAHVHAPVGMRPPQGFLAVSSGPRVWMAL
jgi:hypothetical protein